MFYTYVLHSKAEDKLYVGWTSDLRYRLKQHQDGKVNATKDGRPFELIYYEASMLKSDAISREKSLKTGFGRAYLKKRLSNT